MSVLETEIRKLNNKMDKEFAVLRKMLVTRLLPEKWVNEGVARDMLGGISKRQIDRIRVHLDATKKKVGSIGWRKGAGGKCEYYLPDIEKYKSAFTIMN